MSLFDAGLSAGADYAGITQALNLALSMLTHGQNWRWAAVKALTEATKVVNGLLIRSTSEVGSADLD